MCALNDRPNDRIEFSSLPPRLISVLSRQGISDLSVLAAMDDRQILLLDNIGHDYLQLIKAELARGRGKSVRKQ
ncbi:hypothetical protein SAMN02982989_2567 [Xaviernesmea oryzae]|uniref:RNA polymerase alpha subunit C-terminal domain-containing protein n=1 Tax=Xaviernesmea oryzae TaxID=464029 RepID=A0A1X7FAS4_9HYPH|nr:hypothetical protein SAMN02982989_2567 [Xaviernesmea oryzae]